MDDYDSPFEFHGPLEPDKVFGRDELIADLSARLLAHRPTALLGPRRFGKTSVLRRVAADLAGVGPETIWIDLFGMASSADLAIALDRGLSRTTGKVRRALRSASAGVSVQLGLVGVEFNKPPRNQPDPDIAVHGLLDLLVKAALRHPTLIVLDEFSGLADVPGGAAKLRTYLQHHYREVSLAFAGSEPSTMAMMFADRAQPFFAQADVVEMPPLPADALVDEIAVGFEETGRDPGATTDHLIAFAAGHPQRAMQLADALWRHTPVGTTSSDSTWADALDDVRGAEDNGCERLYAQLPNGHQRTLRAVIAGGGVYGGAARLLRLSPGTATTAVEALIGNGTIRRTDGGLEVIDPIYADWVRRRFPIPG